MTPTKLALAPLARAGRLMTAAVLVAHGSADPAAAAKIGRAHV